MIERREREGERKVEGEIRERSNGRFRPCFICEVQDVKMLF